MSAPRFGYCLPIFANPSAGLFRTPNYDQLDARTTLGLGVRAEDLGFDSLWVADHLMLGREEAILEGWTTLSALGGATSKAQLGLIHQAHFFREPAIAAKMAATLDQLTDGRFILFYDFGRQRRENEAYHLQYPEAELDLVAETYEGIRLIRDLWLAEEPLTAQYGRHGVTAATCTPRPVQQPHPPIWFGEMEPGLLSACADLGQGWNTTPCSLEEFQRRLSLLHAACAEAQRDPASIEVSVEMQVLIAPTRDDLRAQLAGMLTRAPDQTAIDPQLQAFTDGTGDELPTSFTDATFVGTPAEVQAQVARYAEAGADHFLLWFLDAPDPAGMDLFAREVFPAFR
jgi:alkanesulfonate monooxygenase SsuD/methylene tetrahydromethanopterin reductase-like flavin-dependent oxidoreductase (luciferase family)